MAEEITFQDFLDHMQFPQDHRRAASGINVSYERWTEKEQKVVMDMSIFGPQIRFKTNFGHSYIQLQFDDDKNTNYRRLSYLLEKYEADLDNYCSDLDRDDFPALMIVIVPAYYEGRYYMACINLLMYRTYKDDSGVYIELLFENESINVLETDQIDLAAINQQLRKEEETKAYIEQKYLEEKEYEEEREKMREELRRKKQKKGKGR